MIVEEEHAVPSRLARDLPQQSFRGPEACTLWTTISGWCYKVTSGMEGYSPGPDGDFHGPGAIQPGPYNQNGSMGNLHDPQESHGPSRASHSDHATKGGLVRSGPRTVRLGPMLLSDSTLACIEEPSQEAI